MSKELRSLGDTSEFDVSDSRVVTRMLILRLPRVQGPIARIHIGLSGAGTSYQVPSLLKADGAGYMRPKRGRQLVARSISRLGEVCL